jgi:hypothetical protein
VQRLFFEPFFAAQSECEESFGQITEKYNVDMNIWKVELRVLERELQGAIEKGYHSDTIKWRIAEHMRSTPELPKTFRYIYSDVTPADFLYKLYSNNPSAGIISDEAGRIFSSRLVDDLGLLNQTWDGGEVRVDRRTSESFIVKDARVSLSWLVQEAVFQKFLERKGDEARGIGFLARCLISRPQSTQGSRFIRGADIDLVHLPKFKERIRELLHRRLAMNGNMDKEERIELNFSREAQAEWVNVFNRIEAEIRPGGVFCESRDYASKIAENIARIAAVFHTFQGKAGTEIPVETLRSATKLALWYAQQFIALFSPPDPMAETINDAVELERWIIKLIKQRGWTSVEKNFIRQRGPNSLRSRDRLNWALNCLQENGRIFPPVRPSNKILIQFNMNYFAPMAQGIQPQGFYPLS